MEKINLLPIDLCSFKEKEFFIISSIVFFNIWFQPYLEEWKLCYVINLSKTL